MALAATTLGASRAWVPLTLWATGAPRILHQLWPTPDPPNYAQILTWPYQPATSALAAITAVTLGVLGRSRPLATADV